MKVLSRAARAAGLRRRAAMRRAVRAFAALSNELGGRLRGRAVLPLAVALMGVGLGMRLPRKIRNGIKS